MFASTHDPNLIECLKQGGVVVLPTDTLYGIVARTTDERAVERVYRLRGRAPEKPCIILVADQWQITDNSLWTPAHFALAERYWPGALSLIAPVSGKTPHYLHRGTATLAYRVPAEPNLRKLLAATGPLIAPSANTEGEPPASTLNEAYVYFGDEVDGYVDGGQLADAQASTLVKIDGHHVRVLRQGALKLRYT